MLSPGPNAPSFYFPEEFFPLFRFLTSCSLLSLSFVLSLYLFIHASIFSLLCLSVALREFSSSYSSKSPNIINIPIIHIGLVTIRIAIKYYTNFGTTWPNPKEINASSTKNLNLSIILYLSHPPYFLPSLFINYSYSSSWLVSFLNISLYFGIGP